MDVVITHGAHFFLDFFVMVLMNKVCQNRKLFINGLRVNERRF